MTYPLDMSTTPGAPAEAWTTPARPPGPVVTPAPDGQADVPGGQAIEMAGDPGVRGDDVAASVAEAMANAEARYGAHEADTHPQGSALGVALDLPPVPSDWGKATGGLNATAYDPAG
jgi:hypothetical protein